MRSMIITAALSALIFTPCVAFAEVTVSSKDKVTVVEGRGYQAIAETDQISWCVETDGETVCGNSETKWGCQYFPEEGPADDIAVCILTTLAENCCECLSVCPDDDEEGPQAPDPSKVVERIAQVLDPDEWPSCAWRPYGGTHCGLECDGVRLASCYNDPKSGDQWCSVGIYAEKNYGPGHPSPCS